MSMHRFFLALGLKSIHYFVDDANQTVPDHINHDNNWREFRRFIETSDLEAFTDYPVRSFYKELPLAFPDAYYLLTVRSDSDVWRRSMLKYFPNRGVTIDIDHLTRVYERINDAIRTTYGADARRFLEICIDDDSAANTALIKDFLGIRSERSLGWENRGGEDPQQAPASGNGATRDPVTSVEALWAPNTRLLSEHGWVFRCNERNRYLHHAFGSSALDADPTPDIIAAAARQVKLNAERGIGRTMRIIVPEKSSIHREYLPQAFAGLTLSDARPAARLAALRPADLHVIEPLVRDAKAWGQPYHRTRLELSTFGNYLVYAATIDALNTGLPPALQRPPMPLSSLQVQHATLRDETLAALPSAGRLQTLRRLQPGNGCEEVLSYGWPGSAPRADTMRPSNGHALAGVERQTVIEDGGESALRVVIVLLEPMDLAVALLSQHFGRTVTVQIAPDARAAPDALFARETPDIVLELIPERHLATYRGDRT